VKEIIYVMDPLCGWCHGISANLKQIYKKYQDKIDFRVLPGGMWVGPNVSPSTPEKAHFITSHDKVVKRQTGAFFSPEYENNIINNPRHIFNSEPPSRAIVAVGQLSPKSAYLFAEDVLDLQFVAGKDYNNIENYFEAIEKYGINRDQFIKLFKSEKLAKDTLEAFNTVQRIGVTGFPTLLVNRDGELEMLANGYMQYDPLDKLMEKTLAD
jgi:putative protein-disulfide isomerase